MKKIILFILILGVATSFAGVNNLSRGSASIWGMLYLGNTLTGERGGINLYGNTAANNFFLSSDADSFKVRMYKYLYPLEIEIGNTQKFAVDSAGNVIAAGTISAAAFSPTTSSSITSHDILVLTDGDSIMIDPHTAIYMFRIGVGGAKKFAIDSTGLQYGANDGTISNVTNNQWIFGENSEDLNLAFAANNINVTSSTGVTDFDFGVIDVHSDKFSAVGDNDSLVIDPYKDLHALDLQIGGVTKFNVDSAGNAYTAGTLQVVGASTLASIAGNTTVNGKLTISANYPLVSSSSLAADTLKITGGMVNIIDCDTIPTTGSSKSRWLKIGVSKDGATGKPSYFYVPLDTTIVNS